MECFEVKIVNAGWRSYVACQLCITCPKGDQKGCCHYSPRYMLPDLLYFFQYDQDFLSQLLTMANLEINEESISVQSSITGELGSRCQFHSTNGCQLKPEQRDLVCRLYICPDIKLWREPELTGWRSFFGQLQEDYLNMQEKLLLSLQESGRSLKSCATTALDLLNSREADLNFYRKDQVCGEFNYQLVRDVQRGEVWRI